MEIMSDDQVIDKLIETFSIDKSSYEIDYRSSRILLMTLQKEKAVRMMKELNKLMKKS